MQWFEVGLDRLDKLRALIRQHIGIKENDQRLYYGAVELEDGRLSFFDEGIPAQAEISCWQYAEYPFWSL